MSSSDSWQWGGGWNSGGWHQDGEWPGDGESSHGCHKEQILKDLETVVKELRAVKDVNTLQSRDVRSIKTQVADLVEKVTALAKRSCRNQPLLQDLCDGVKEILKAAYEHKKKDVCCKELRCMKEMCFRTCSQYGLKTDHAAVWKLLCSYVKSEYLVMWTNMEIQYAEMLVSEIPNNEVKQRHSTFTSFCAWLQGVEVMHWDPQEVKKDGLEKHWVIDIMLEMLEEIQLQKLEVKNKLVEVQRKNGGKGNTGKGR